MAGSWERTKFDDGEYQHYIKETTGALMYQLDPNKYYNCRECRPEQPGYIGSGVSISNKNTLVDVESDLKNITRRQTRDPKGKYLPCKKPETKHIKNLPSCNILTDETRLSNPACNLRSTGVSQHIFYELCQNPQDLATLEHPGLININDKQLAKDNHKPILPKPLKQTGVPPAKKVAMPKCCPNSNSQLECVFTDPLSPNYQNKKHKSLHIQPALEYNYERLMKYHNNL